MPHTPLLHNDASGSDGPGGILTEFSTANGAAVDSDQAMHALETYGEYEADVGSDDGETDWDPTLDRQQRIKERREQQEQARLMMHELKSVMAARKHIP